MIHERIYLSDTSKAYLETYLLSPSDQIQIGWKHPAVIVCPGGAYLRTSDQEAEQVALHFNAQGYHAAVLRYSCQEAARMPNPLLELALGVHLLRSRSESWHIASDKIVVCGFSAGGHLCAMLSTQYAQAAKLLGLAAADVRPDAAILGYPCTDMNYPPKLVSIDNFVIGKVDPACPEKSVIPLYKCALCKKGETWMLDFMRPMKNYLFDPQQPPKAEADRYSPCLHVTPTTTPTFVWTTANDDLVPAMHSIRYAMALWEQGVACEFHMFENGPHGLSLADETVADNAAMVRREVAAWFSLAVSWLKGRFSTPGTSGNTGARI